jgi:hypothetical protein
LAVAISDDPGLIGALGGASGVSPCFDSRSTMAGRRWHDPTKKSNPFVPPVAVRRTPNVEME